MLYHVIRIPFIALHSTHAAFQIRSGAMDSYTSSVTNKCLYSNTTCSIRIGNSETQPFQEGCVKVLFSLTYTLTGRYDNIPRDERLFSLCNCNKIEDETHLLLDGPIFSSIRNMFLN